MEHIRDYVERLKAKPADHRRRFAFGASLAIALVIAAGWMTVVVSSGTLALSSPTTEAQNAQLSQSAKEASDQFSGLLGAASAYRSGTDAGAVTVVDGKSSSTLDSSGTDTRTVIPF